MSRGFSLRAKVQDRTRHADCSSPDKTWIVSQFEIRLAGCPASALGPKQPVVINETAGNDSCLRSLEELRMDERQSGSEDDAAIRDVVESWTAAVRRRDIGGILQNYSSGIVIFDVPPPFQSRGIEAYRKTWDLFFLGQAIRSPLILLK